jgi:hypothetical protein
MLIKMIYAFFFLSISFSTYASEQFVLDFNGSDNYVGTNFYPDSNTKTLMYWVKLDTTDESQVIGAHDGNNNRFYLGINEENHLFAGVGDSFSNHMYSGIVLGSWVHLAITADDQIAKVYINGTEMTSFAYTFNGTSSKDILIGARNYSSPDSFIDGQIDDVQVWDIVLSQEKIKKYMLSPPVGTENGVILYYSFDEGDGVVAHNFASSENHGGLVNTPLWTLEESRVGVGSDGVIKGNITGIWSNPTSTESTNMSVNGVDTPYFEYGQAIGNVNRLNFLGGRFDIERELVFKLGTLTYSNGTVSTGTTPSTVELQLLVDFESPSIQRVSTSLELALLSTPNTGTELENADYVYFPDSISSQEFTIDNDDYVLELVGFSEDGGASITEEFHVLEDHTASAELYGVLRRLNKKRVLPAIINLLMEPSESEVFSRSLWRQLVQSARVGDILLFGLDRGCEDGDNCAGNASALGFDYGYYSHTALITEVDKQDNSLTIFHAKGSEYPEEEQVSSNKYYFGHFPVTSHGYGILSLARVQGVSDEMATEVAHNAILKYNSYQYAAGIPESDETYCSKLVSDAYHDFGYDLTDADSGLAGGGVIPGLFFTPDELSRSDSIKLVNGWWY